MTFEQIKADFHHRKISEESTEGIFDCLYGLVRLRRPNSVVELGACVGYSTAFITKALMENGSGEIMAYELRQDFVIRAVSLLDELFPDGHVAAVIEQDVYALPDQSIPCDFAFVDIDPKERYWEAFMKLRLSPGAMVCFHDSTHRGVGHLVRNIYPLLDEHGFDFINIPEERGLVVAIRRV